MKKGKQKECPSSESDTKVCLPECKSGHRYDTKIEACVPVGMTECKPGWIYDSKNNTCTRVSDLSKESALASITALRNWNSQLENLAEQYAKKPGYGSHIESVRRFQKTAKKAFDELQEITGDKTPWEIKRR